MGEGKGNGQPARGEAPAEGGDEAAGRGAARHPQRTQAGGRSDKDVEGEEQLGMVEGLPGRRGIHRLEGSVGNLWRPQRGRRDHAPPWEGTKTVCRVEGVMQRLIGGTGS